MTNSPEPTTPDSNRTRAELRRDAAAAAAAETGSSVVPVPTPVSASASAPRSSGAGVAAAPVASAAGQAAASLDTATFDRVVEPASPNRLPLGDGTWHQLARAYVTVRLISIGAFFGIVLVAALGVSLLARQSWVWLPAAVVLFFTAWTFVITPRQARATGYQLRDDDLVFRRGILWQRMVAVPYGRMQLVDITHGPLDRAFGIAQLKLVTAAASTGVIIPGLTQGAAQQLRDTLVDVAETRRTGL